MFSSDLDTVSILGVVCDVYFLSKDGDVGCMCIPCSRVPDLCVIFDIYLLQV
jgi:hypothetical protein